MESHRIQVNKEEMERMSALLGVSTSVRLPTGAGPPLPGGRLPGGPRNWPFLPHSAQPGALSPHLTPARDITLGKS